MGILCAWVVFGISLCAIGWSEPQSGYLLTSPKYLDSDTTEYLTFTTFNTQGNSHVTVKLLHWHTREVLAESKVTATDNWNTWLELAVPSSPMDVRARLQLRGTLGGGMKVDEEKEVMIRHASVIIFLQMDKPVYRPGQTVKFRVLPLDNQLRPLDRKSKGDVWVRDPSGIRVMQWNQIRFDAGILQMELPLSEEPPLGAWSVGASINQITRDQEFEVQEYVLPKFEVTVKPPPIVMADAEVIPVEVCAWYTYGKRVDGSYKVKVTYKRYPWEKKSRAIPSIKYSGLISGCETINIHTGDLLMQTHEYGYRTLKFFAKVTENGTGTESNASSTLDITHSPLQVKFIGPDTDHFKPGIPYYGAVLVNEHSGQPVSGEKIEICAHYHDKPPTFYNRAAPKEKRCQLFTSSKKGTVAFSLAPMPSTVLRIELVAEAVSFESVPYQPGVWRDKLVRPSATLELRAWFSPSGHYLQIQTPPDEMECGSRQALMVRYTVEPGVTLKFYHQVVSRGRIVQQGSHQRYFIEQKGQKKKERHDFPAPDTPRPRPYQHHASPNGTASELSDVGEFLLSFDPRATMSPMARLLVFYTREAGEVVADSRVVRIARCFPNKVNMDFRHEQQYPSTEASLLLSATPNSLCGIGMVDKSVRLLKHEQQFSAKKIFQILERYDIGREDRPRQMSEDHCNQGDPDSPPKPKEDDGLFYTPFSRSVSYHADTVVAFEEAGMVVMSNFPLETRPCVPVQPVAISYNMDNDNSRFRSGLPGAGGVQQPVGQQLIVSRDPQPKGEESEPAKPSIAEEIRNYFPETWLWELHDVGPSGQTVVKSPLPHTITKWVGGAVCVSVKSGLGLWEESSITAFQPFFVSFDLPYSVVRGEKLPLVVSIFNYLSECLPIQLSLEPSDGFRILSESHSHRACVCGGQSRSHRFLLEPQSPGLVNVTVRAHSTEDDEVCGNEVTARLTARDAVSKQLRVEAEGFPKEEVFNYFVCPENTNGTYATEVDLLLPEDIVEGSVRGFVSVTGDLMGPALNGLTSLVKLPVGCGEQNMVLFAPNVFVLDYLTSTRRLTEEIKSDCIYNIKMGEQRQMRYLHEGGSFSAFGPGGGAEGSLWLTAFVVRSFGHAHRFVEVDFFLLQHSAAWIASRQMENGCFQNSGRLFNKAIKGGLNEGEHSLAPLSAYVLIALVESGILKPDSTVIRNGLRCLETDSNPGMYALALFAYASALAKEKRAAYHYLKRLEERAIVRGGLTYWDPPPSEGGSLGVGVEIAGYYILCRAHLEGRESAAPLLPVVRWMARQRNGNGGFVSTQDTVVGLQALAQYSALQASNPADLGLVVESDELVTGFKVDEQNALLTQSARIPVLPTVVDLQAVGEGCALVQFSLRYNVRKVSGHEALDLSVNAVRLGSSACNLPRLDICIRYKIPDQKSNMAVVSVKMPSGFLPDDWSLHELRADPDVQLQRHELVGNVVNLYFDELGNSLKCFKFFIKSETEVEEIKPSTVVLYDYYQPELEISRDFTIPSSCSSPSLPDIPLDLPDILKTPDFDLKTYSILPFPAAENTSTPVLKFETTLSETATGPLLSTLPTDVATSTDDSARQTIEDTPATPTDASIHSTTEETPTTSNHPAIDEMTVKPAITSPGPAAEEMLATPTPSSHRTSEEVPSTRGSASTLPAAEEVSATQTSTSTHSTSEEMSPETTSALVATEERSTTPTTSSHPAAEEMDVTPATSSHPVAEEMPVTPTTSIHPASEEITSNETSEGQYFENTLTSNEGQVDEQADQPDRNNRHLVSFQDVDHDLDFPDGIEGNMPVSVLPPLPETTPSEASTELSPDCPICMAQIPEDFSDIYCNSAFALRVVSRDGKAETVKILHDVSYFLPQPKMVKKLAKLEYDRKCACARLKEKGSAHFVMGTPTDLWSSELDKHKIRLTSQVHVISIPHKTSQSELLKTARKKCSSDP